MADRKWETNWQRTENGPWKSKAWNTKEEAKQAAEDWAGWGAWNANWQAQTQGAESSPAWTARNGQRK